MQYMNNENNDNNNKKPETLNNNHIKSPNHENILNTLEILSRKTPLKKVISPKFKTPSKTPNKNKTPIKNLQITNFSSIEGSKSSFDINKTYDKFIQDYNSNILNFSKKSPRNDNSKDKKKRRISLNNYENSPNKRIKNSNSNFNEYDNTFQIIY
ncbi:hypothetical protein BCR32DRAFT_301191 [Anaeromyces robustus]|uniref:Uncharacterized protein n=1 Tax=Anaeromyces robustus TaxID=1754192 RepID=A0A1Y1X0D2_9FUNG|nr:hypothetical protein BCR32DRAFT_301191 [Anaeromyces robustus]|eukprot:ORX79058.1 hypothetical protein BCR32DRAFT_301191 [Anaeromyces robustus]